MSDPRRSDATRSLVELTVGAPGAADRLFAIVQTELRALAARILRRERAGHTLQPTALVNEAYLRLVDAEAVSAAGRTQFLGIAGRAIRQILVDHARGRGADKRGGDRERVTLVDEPAATARGEVDLLALEEALQRLAKLNERRARVVELRVFGGLSVDEAAVILGVSPRTVDVDWRIARAWLRSQLEPELD